MVIKSIIGAVCTYLAVVSFKASAIPTEADWQTSRPIPPELPSCGSASYLRWGLFHRALSSCQCPSFFLFALGLVSFLSTFLKRIFPTHLLYPYVVFWKLEKIPSAGGRKGDPWWEHWGGRGSHPHYYTSLLLTFLSLTIPPTSSAAGLRLLSTSF